jgi:hypothetical protein
MDVPRQVSQHADACYPPHRQVINLGSVLPLPFKFTHAVALLSFFFLIMLEILQMGARFHANTGAIKPLN